MVGFVPLLMRWTCEKEKLEESMIAKKKLSVYRHLKER